MAEFPYHKINNDWKRDMFVTLGLRAREDQTISVTFMISTFLVSEIL